MRELPVLLHEADARNLAQQIGRQAKMSLPNSDKKDGNLHFDATQITEYRDRGVGADRRERRVRHLPPHSARGGRRDGFRELPRREPAGRDTAGALNHHLGPETRAREHLGREPPAGTISDRGEVHDPHRRRSGDDRDLVLAYRRRDRNRTRDHGGDARRGQALARQLDRGGWQARPEWERKLLVDRDRILDPWRSMTVALAVTCWRASWMVRSKAGMCSVRSDSGAPPSIRQSVSMAVSPRSEVLAGRATSSVAEQVTTRRPAPWKTMRALGGARTGARAAESSQAVWSRRCRCPAPRRA